MGKVIDAADQFEFKALLNGASKNVELLGAALAGTAEPIQAGIEQALTFVREFLSGRVKPFPSRLEDSDVLYDIMGTNPDLYGQIIRLALKYGGPAARHDLTLALSQAFPEARLMVVSTYDGLSLHSGLWSHEHELFLDANGVHTREAIIQHWTGSMLGAPVYLKPVSQEAIIDLSQLDAAGLEEALNGFGVLTTYMLANLEALVAEPDCDGWDDLDEDDDFSPAP